MKKIPLIFLLVLTSFGLRAQTSVQVTRNFPSTCTITVRLISYTSGCSPIGITSNALILGPGATTYTTTSAIWPMPLPPGAEIKAAIVTDACSNNYHVGDPCTIYPASTSIACSPCFSTTNNCRWLTGSTTELVIQP